VDTYEIHISANNDKLSIKQSSLILTRKTKIFPKGSFDPDYEATKKEDTSTRTRTQSAVERPSPTIKQRSLSVTETVVISGPMSHQQIKIKQEDSISNKNTTNFPKSVNKPQSIVRHSQTITKTIETKIERDSEDSKQEMEDTKEEMEDYSFTKEITQLMNMGFNDRATNLKVLKKNKGNFVNTVTELVSLM